MIALLLRGLVGALAVSVLLTASALAHAEIVGADPADGSVVVVAPDRLQLLFSEPIEARFYSVRVYDANRSRVDRGAAFLSTDDRRVVETQLGELTSGTYTVVWRVLSVDGHIARGSFSFGVGPGSRARLSSVFETPDEGVPIALDLATRWALYVGTLLVVGGFAFRSFVLVPTRAPLDIAAGGRHIHLTRWGMTIIGTSLGVAIAAHLAGLIVQAASVADAPITDLVRGNVLAEVLGSTRYGAIWLARSVLFLVLVPIVVWAARDQTGDKLWYVGGAVGASLLLTISAASHATTASDQILVAVALDWVHLLAASVWLGGLAQLATLLIRAWRGSWRDGPLLIPIGVLVRRVSPIAALSALLLALTGLYSAVVHIPSWQALVDTSYGAAFSGKVLLVLLLAGVGAASALMTWRAAPSGLADQSWVRTVRPLLVTVLGEIVLGFAVVAATSILTAQQPAAGLVAGRPFRETRAVGAASVELSLTPNQAGDNRIEVGIRTPPGEPFIARQLPIQLVMLDMDMGSQELTAEQIGPGRYEVSAALLSMAGRWGLGVDVPDSDGTPAGVEFEVTVGPSPDTNRPALSPAQILLLAVARPGADGSPAANWPFLSAALALAVGGALLTWRAIAPQAPTSRGVRGSSLLATGICLLVFGLPLGGVSLAEAYYRSLPAASSAAERPASDESAIARGREVYRYCTACHGPGGRGDGPSSVGLSPPPADFRVHMAAGHSDQQIYDWIAGGMAGSAMPPFGGALARDEILDVMSYIKTFAELE